MVAWNGHPDFVDKLGTVNRAPRMKAIYTSYLNNWRVNGGELLFLLGSVQIHGKYGYWGMLERQDQPLGEAPKFAAALQFVAQQPGWWTDPWPSPPSPPSPNRDAAPAISPTAPRK